MWKLKKVDGDGIFEISKDRFIIGRNSKADIVLHQGHVSRTHATLSVSEGKLYIQDHNTCNGTFVNNVRIASFTKNNLNVGDIISIGSVSTNTQISQIVYYQVLYEGAKQDNNDVDYLDNIDLSENLEAIEKFILDEPKNKIIADGNNKNVEKIRSYNELINNNLDAEANLREDSGDTNIVINEKNDLRNTEKVVNSKETKSEDYTTAAEDNTKDTSNSNNHTSDESNKSCENNISDKLDNSDSKKQDNVPECSKGFIETPTMSSNKSVQSTVTDANNIVSSLDDCDGTSEMSSSSNGNAPIKTELNINFFNDDDVIVLTDDDDDDYLFCSQLMSVDQKKDCSNLDESLFPYIDIKRELAELDYTEENLLNKVPIDIDNNFSSTNDLVNTLESPILTIPLIPLERCYEKDKSPTLDDFDMGNEQISIPESISLNDAANARKETPKTNTRLSAQKYVKPPIIEALHLPRNCKTKNESSIAGIKRRLSTNEETQAKLNLSSNKDQIKSKRRRMSRRPSVDSKTEQLSRQEKKDIANKRKAKLKEITQKHDIAKSNRKETIKTAKVKVSESRGSFLLEPGPSSVPVKRKTNLKAYKIPSIPLKSNSTSDQNKNNHNGTSESNKISKLSFKDFDPSTLMRGLPKRQQNYVNHQVNLQDICEKIVQWEVKWLNRQNSTPPVNQHTPVKMSTSFNSFSDYSNVISPLMFLELWEYISQSFQKEVHEPIRVLMTGHRFVGDNLYMDCESYLEQKQARDILKTYDYSLIEYKYVDPTIQKRALRVSFCLTQNVNWRVLDENEMVEPNVLAELCTGVPHTKLKFTLLTKNVNHHVPSNPVFIMKQVANVHIFMKLFKTLRLLEKTPICRFITKPTLQDYHIAPFEKNIFIKEMLNLQQITIVQEATKLCLGKDPGMYLVQGPPGTGKTRLIISLLIQILFHESSKPPLILLAAPSNSAVDNLLMKLQEYKYFLTDVQRKKIKAVRIGPENSIGKSVHSFKLSSLTKRELFYKLQKNDDYNPMMKEQDRDAYVKRKYGSRYKYEYKLTEDGYLYNSNVICTTLNSSVNFQISEAVRKQQLKFTCCIVDEATQCSELECLMPTQLGIDKFVLVGDPKQLPATVQNPEAMNLGYSKSLFERIIENFNGKRNCPIHMLTTQYRMSEEISRFPNQKFYGGKLKSMPLFKNKIVPTIRPYLVFTIKETQEHSNKNQQVYTNSTEVTFVRELIQVLTTGINENCPYNIGVLTPYAAQKDKIIQAISNIKLPNLVTINVNTVDSFQGQENDIIIISCVRYAPNNFLTNEKRLNVALTRARQGLYIVGNYTLYKHCQILYDLREDAKKRRVLKDFNGLPKNLNSALYRCIFSLTKSL